MYVLALDGVLGALESIRSQIVGARLAAFGSLAAVIGGLLAGVVLLKTAHDYIEGQGVTLWTIVRPFALLLCVCNFNTFVAGPVHSVCNMFTRGLSRQANVSMSQYMEALKDAVVAEYNAGNAVVDNDLDISGKPSRHDRDNEEENGFLRFLQKIDRGLELAVNAVAAAVMGTVHTVLTVTEMSVTMVFNFLLFFMMKVVMFGQQVYCYVYLTILSLLGPFAFAFAILPSFSQTIRSWVARYIQVSFWIPVGQLVMFINYQVLLQMASFDAAYQFGKGWVCLACTIVAILNILAVPKIAAYVIDSTGANDAHGNVNHAGKVIGGLIIGKKI